MSNRSMRSKVAGRTTSSKVSRRFCGAVTAAGLCLFLAAAHADPHISIEMQAGAPVLASDTNTNRRVVLEQRSKLTAGNWEELGQVSDRLYAYPDVTTAGHAGRFYRIVTSPLQSTDDWSNQIRPADGALFTTNTGSGLAGVRFAKFQFLLSRPDQVWFQDSEAYATHYEFAVARLPGYAGMTVPEYNEQSLYTNGNQQMVVGTVMRAPDPLVHEIGIQIVGNDPFPISSVAEWVQAVNRRVVLDTGWQSFYMPTAAQRDAAMAATNELASYGITVDSLVRWATEDACYSPGWAFGKLVFVAGSNITEALNVGSLALNDILVTDWVPAELPVLPGYLSLEPATPSSHVALLARALAIPFAYANTQGVRDQISDLYGKEVLLVVEETNSQCRITLTDTTGLLTPEQRQEIIDSMQGGALDIAPIASTGTISLVVDDLTPAEIKYAGGKAANFGFLRRSIPTNSPAPAIAFTFDLWNAYLSQTLPEGKTLRAKIDELLGGYTYPPDIATIRSDLETVRDLFRNTADFDSAQQTAIIAALQDAGFGGKMIRFRSSTNVEDSDTFNGAGLYDSYSGCIEDDLDGDVWGPCRCDPTEPDERGVFRAIRKVYASFYNENAFLERLRRGISESDVGMAVLVHYSFPDPIEMANGVALLAIERTGSVRRAEAHFVTQLGAESVTNPDVTKRPETTTASFTGTNTAGATLTFVESSSLTSNGAHVMTWEGDYRELLAHVNAAALAYGNYYTNKNEFELDFEFKRVEPGHIVVKQIRAVPHPEPVPPPVITGAPMPTNNYIVIDLSAGPSATNYPVSYLDAAPTNGWTDTHKSTNLVLRRIPAGSFTMGSPSNEVGRVADETQHAVTVSQDFYVGVFEVTQKQWERVMGTWPSHFTNPSYRDTRPVEQVSYEHVRGTGAGALWPDSAAVDAGSFIGKLRARTGLNIDLPTESEWEYAGRAGEGTSLNSGVDLASVLFDANLASVGRYLGNGGSGGEGDPNAPPSKGSAQVGTYTPNAWGLYDIHGNVLEWCLDNYGAYPAGPVTDPKGHELSQGTLPERVWRGGSWDAYAGPCRMATRAYRFADHVFMNLGLRLAVRPRM